MSAVEMLTIDMSIQARLRLDQQIAARMDKLGIGAYRWDKLDLGFEMPAGWPVDRDALPTLAQLVVLARKLKMRIIIGDLVMSPMQET